MEPASGDPGWEEEIDESLIRALALQIVAAEGIPLTLATDKAAIMLYGSDVRAIPEPPPPEQEAGSGQS